MTSETRFAASAQKSTHARTAQGEGKPTSNSLESAITGLQNSKNFVQFNRLSTDVADNLLQQFAPATFTETILVHRLIHFQIRFLQMGQLYSIAFDRKPSDILADNSRMLPRILNELDRLPDKIANSIAAIRAEQLRRRKNTESKPIEPIPNSL